VHRAAGVHLHPERAVSTGWFDRAVAAAAPAVRDEIARQVDEQLRTGAAPTDPTAEALARIDRSLSALGAIARPDRDTRWQVQVDFLLDSRVRHMGDRDRGYRLVDRLANRARRAAA
jgi:hypothetical protein